VTPAVIAFFIGSYMGGIWSVAFPDSSVWPPLWWLVTYGLFLALNIFGVALSFRVTLIVTLLSLAVLIVFWISAIPSIDFSRWALNIGVGPDGAAIELPEGNGSMFPFGLSGVLATLPFAVWLFLAIEQLPLAAEESVDPKRDMPRGIIAGMLTLMVSAFMIVLLNPSVVGVGSFKLATSGEPLLDGFRAIYGDSGAVLLGVIALIGLIASFHTIIFAMGRQVYSLSRAGYFPSALSVTHKSYKTPYVAMFAGAIVGFGIMLIMWFALGGATAGSLIGSVLLNMAVFGAMFSYILQAVSFILLRQNQPNMERPYRSPLGVPGAVLTIIIGVVTLLYQIQDANFTKGVVWVALWFAIAIVYFGLVGRHKLILSPEEEFALEHAQKA
ncbi:MAG: amino acid permease, partial [Mesorhizobium sp.]